MYPCYLYPSISHVPLGMSGTCVHRWNQNETEITIALLNWLDEDFPKNVYPSLYPPRLAGLYPCVPSPQFIDSIVHHFKTAFMHECYAEY